LEADRDGRSRDANAMATWHSAESFGTRSSLARAFDLAALLSNCARHGAPAGAKKSKRSRTWPLFDPERNTNEINGMIKANFKDQRPNQRL
jgi:hypothetical protein